MTNYEFTYKWKHIPTGKTGERKRIFVSYEQFLESINSWNRIGQGEWLTPLAGRQVRRSSTFFGRTGSYDYN